MIDYLYPIILFIFFLFLFNKLPFFKNSGLHKNELYFFFALKVLMGIALYSIYTFYYSDRATADIFKYFDDGEILAALASQDFKSFLNLFFGKESDSAIIQQTLDKMQYWSKPENFGLFKDNRTMIRLNTLLHFISLGSFHVHALFFSFLSFTGLIAFYRFFRTKWHSQKWMLFVGLLLFPSFLLWSSSTLKETLLIFYLGLLFFFAFCKQGKWKWLLIAALIVLSYLLKFYVLLCFVPSFLFLFLNAKCKWNNYVNLLLSIALPVFLFFVLKHIFNYDIVNFIAMKQTAFFDLQAASGESGSFFQHPTMNSELKILLYAPLSISNILFRPFIWEANSVFVALLAFENIFILLLVLLNIFFYRRWDIKWFLFSLLFVLTYAVLIGSSTPNFGAIARYRIPLLPFVILPLLHSIDFKRIFNKFPFLKILSEL